MVYNLEIQQTQRDLLFSAQIVDLSVGQKNAVSVSVALKFGLQHFCLYKA